MSQPSETGLLKENVTQEVSFIPGLGCSTKSMYETPGGGGGGKSHMKQTGMLVGNFEFNP